MKNLVADGKVVKYVNTGSAIASGDVVAFGSCVGVAVTDIAATTGEGSVALEGVYELAKVTGTAWVQGDKLFWDAVTSKFTKVAEGNKPAGVAYEAAESAAALGSVKLEPSVSGVAAHQADTVAADLAALKVDFNLLLDKLIAAGLMAAS